MKFFYSKIKAASILTLGLLLLSLIFSTSISAQNDIVDDLLKAEKPKREYVAYTFKTTRVICGHSVEMVKKNALDFRVSHRFGNIADKNAAHSLAGFYAISDVLFSFEYGALADLTVGVVATKGAGPVRELYSAFAKYRILKQTKDFKIPLTITLFGNACVSGMKSDPFVTSDDFSKGSAAHRFSYVLQSMIAIKATDWLSVQLTPSFVWRNYVGNELISDNPGKDQNGLFFLGLSARAKVSKRSAIIFEYFLPITSNHATYREYFPMLRGIDYNNLDGAGKKTRPYYPSLNLGYEIETGGHVFHINLTNTEALQEGDFLPYTASNWAKGEFRLGFTVARTFQFGNKSINPWNGKPKKIKKDL